jgi:IclR family acetate operon transcriptional repressor
VKADQRNLWIGRRLRELSLDVVHNDFMRSAVRQELRQVAEEIGETCNIASLDGTEVIYLQRVEARWPLRLNLDLDSRIPIHCCASGKLFLALMPTAHRERVLRSVTLEALTPATLTTEAELDREMARVVAATAPTAAAAASCGRPGPRPPGASRRSSRRARRR